MSLLGESKQNRQSQNGAIRKSIMRNAELPIGNEKIGTAKNNPQNKPLPISSPATSTLYHEPRMNTLKNLQKRFDDLKNSESTRFDRHKELVQRSQQLDRHVRDSFNP